MIATPSLDLNGATAEQLAAVFGAGAIGEVFALRIVEERDRLGDFASVDQAAAAVALEPQLRERLARSAYVSIAADSVTATASAVQELRPRSTSDRPADWRTRVAMSPRCPALPRRRDTRGPR